jgi:site-specific DNA-methyltransferase (adenine-specific)
MDSAEENALATHKVVGDLLSHASVAPDIVEKPRRRCLQHANELSGAEWTRCSISVWNDIQKAAEELRLGHPAIFPEVLVTRLLKCFTRADEKVVLDPFVGTGSTAVAAYKMRKTAIGLDISKDFLPPKLMR